MDGREVGSEGSEGGREKEVEREEGREGAPLVWLWEEERGEEEEVVERWEGKSSRPGRVEMEGPEPLMWERSKPGTSGGGEGKIR